MRRAFFGPICLASCLACARTPSSVPLGGDEWLRPEPHFDRRAPGQTAEARPSAVPTAPATPPPASAPPLPAASAAAAPSPPPSPGEVSFGFAPLAKGDVVTLRTRYSGRMTIAVSLAGQTSSQELALLANERIEVRVVDATADAVRELDVAYIESKSEVRVNDAPLGSDVENNAGKRYRVRLGPGSSSVTPASGSLKPDEDKGVLFDLASVIGYAPFVKARLPATLSSGWRAQVPAADVLQAFGGGFQSVRFEAASLALLGRDPTNAELAAFECTLPVRIEHDGMAVTARLRGNLTVRPKETSPVSVLLRGPVSGDGGPALGGATKISGSLEVGLEHEYRR